ncbi:MAG TPA: hypothetical protein VEH07_00305 [Alphaproteobacteria bacterium]|nr:hypothetical protein [Alphaproteobacteria bacterium]
MQRLGGTSSQRPALPSVQRWALVAVLTASVLVPMQAARATVVLMDQTVQIVAGGYALQKFYLNVRGMISVSFAPALGALLMSEANCDTFVKSSGTSPVDFYERATGGSLSHVLDPGRYCVVLVNTGTAAVQSRLVIEGEQR